MSRALCGSVRAVLAAVLVLGSVAQADISIETVLVDNVGNTADTTGYGAVDYSYNIGKYEVTAGQYTAFLNAVAKTDTYDLYNPNMALTNNGSGITRSGSPGDYTYSVEAAFVSRPVNYVSFWDAVRFANWLHNGQPTGAQDNSTTEDGAYTLTWLSISDNSVTRNMGWMWAVASEDEWYKAAYHKNDGNTANYFFYPTSSDSVPGTDLADPSGNNANYFGGVAYPIAPPYYTTLAGEFQISGSPYGTFDQGGNVDEWNEAIIFDVTRGFRGGSFNSLDDGLQSDFRSMTDPTTESDTLGFRVVHPIPEPSTMALVAFSVAVLFGWRRRGGR
jgi:formylglycine-generating enzyme required for sulfatase activity